MPKGDPITQLPAHRLDPRMLRVWRISDVVGIVVVAVLAVVAWAIWWPFAAALNAGALWLFGLSGLLDSAAWLLRPLLVAAAALSVALLVGLVVNALRACRYARFGHTLRELVLVTGGLTRLTTVAPRARLQRMELAANPFQRRAGVASLSVRTAAGTSDGLELRDLPAEAADKLLAWFRLRG